MTNVIDTLEIKGLHSHENTHITFHNGVNVIVGESDTGKSATMRPVYWVRFNRPSTTVLSREGESKIEATVSSGGVAVRRVKTKSKNYYTVASDGHEMHFANVGTDVPKEVAEALPLQSMNFLRQRDPIFFLTRAPGDRVRLLNEQVSDLWMIDRFQADFSKDIRAHESAENAAKDEAELAEERAQQLDWVPSLQQRIQEAWATDKRLADDASEFNKVAESVEQSQNIRAKLPAQGLVQMLLRASNGVMQKITAVENAKGDYKDIQKAVSDAGYIRCILSETPRLTEDLTGHITKLVERAETSANERRRQYGEARIVLDSANVLEEALETKRRAVERKQKEFNAKFPDTCPLCGADWSEHKGEC